MPDADALALDDPPLAPPALLPETFAAVLAPVVPELTAALPAPPAGLPAPAFPTPAFPIIEVVALADPPPEIDTPIGTDTPAPNEPLPVKPAGLAAAPKDPFPVTGRTPFAASEPPAFNPAAVLTVEAADPVVPTVTGLLKIGMVMLPLPLPEPLAPTPIEGIWADAGIPPAVDSTTAAVIAASPPRTRARRRRLRLGCLFPFINRTPPSPSRSRHLSPIVHRSPRGLNTSGGVSA